MRKYTINLDRLMKNHYTRQIHTDGYMTYVKHLSLYKEYSVKQISNVEMIIGKGHMIHFKSVLLL